MSRDELIYILMLAIFIAAFCLAGRVDMDTTVDLTAGVDRALIVRSWENNK